MRIFISEFVCGGGWPGDRAESLAREGEAMLRAVVEDFSRIDGVRVTTTWDARLGPHRFSDAQVIPIDSPELELPIFHELAGICDATLVIAPETDGILSQRAQIALQNGAHLLGPSVEAIELCSDKYQLARHWRQRGIETIPTYRLDEETPREFPVVVKPRDGAGSQGIRQIGSAAELAELTSRELSDSTFVWQPFIPGRAVSCALFFSPGDAEPILFPPAEQRLSDDGRFSYLGGRIPAREVDQAAIQRAAAGACAVAPGLAGYVGVDLVVRESDQRPIPVEINPRLTTSYVGYRAHSLDNLALQFCPDRWGRSMPRWREEETTFSPSGVTPASTSE